MPTTRSFRVETGSLFALPPIGYLSALFTLPLRYLSATRSAANLRNPALLVFENWWVEQAAPADRARDWSRSQQGHIRYVKKLRQLFQTKLNTL